MGVEGGKMKIIPAIAFALFSAFCAVSQVHVASIDLSTDMVEDVQTQVIGDSLFIAVDWFDASPNPKLKKGYWVGSAGTVNAIDFGFLQKVVLCAIEQVDEAVYYYYLDFMLDKKRERKIRVARSDKKSKQIQNIDQSIPFEGDLLGILNEDGIQAISFDKKALKFKVITISDGRIVATREIQLDYKLANFWDGPITVVKDKSVHSIADGSSLNKLYYTKEELVLVASNYYSQTLVIKMNLQTGNVNYYKVPVDFEKKATYYESGLLYYLSASNNEYNLQIFDMVSQKKIFGKAFARLDAFKLNPVYRRMDKEVKVYKDGSLYQLMNRNSDLELSILVEDHLSNKLITFGDFFDEKGGGIAAGSNPFTMFAVFMVTTALRQQFGKGAGQSRYSYLLGDTTRTNGFKIKTEFKTEKPWRQIIDDFEIDEQNKGVDFNTKNYQLLESKKIAVIYHTKKQKSIRVLRF